MRDIVAVIDAVLAEIPDDDEAWDTHMLKRRLRVVQENAEWQAPENQVTQWGTASMWLEEHLPWPPVELWQQRVADIWSGKTEVQS